jgi:hypothetical protein
MKRCVRCAAAALLVALGGCATVEPWQRGYLARPDMALEPSPGIAKALEKTFASKEAASGSGAVGGGGCGCN